MVSEEYILRCIKVEGPEGNHRYILADVSETGRVVVPIIQLGGFHTVKDLELTLMAALENIRSMEPLLADFGFNDEDEHFHTLMDMEMPEMAN